MKNRLQSSTSGLLARLMLCAVVALGATFGPASADAQEPSREELQEFRSHLEKGGKLLEAEEYEQAIEELEQARAIVDHPKISLSIANAYRKSSQCTEAREEYDKLARRDDIDEEMESKVAEGIAELKACEAEKETELAKSEPEPTPEVAPPPTETEPSTGEPGWVSYVSWGAIGVGAGLAVGGVVNDIGSINRTEELAEAQRGGDMERIGTLEDEAARANTRSAILYTSGAVLITTGVVLQLVDFGPERSAQSSGRPSVTAGLTPTGVTTIIRW